MGRKNRRDLVLRIRFKDSEGMPKTSLVISNDHKNVKNKFGGGRILKIGKMSPEQIYKIGEYNELPEKLMQEFAQENREKRFLRIKPVTDI